MSRKVRAGTGARILPPETLSFTKDAVDDYFDKRYVDDRFGKRRMNVLKCQDALSDELRFELKGINLSQCHDHRLS